MAYIYPYAGHNSNTVTTNNGDNQPITPTHHICGSKSSTQPNQIATSALKTAGKSHFISFFSFRKTGAVVLLLIMTMGTNALGNIPWDNDHRGKYYSMCSETPRNGPNNNNITNCTQCSVTQTITMSSDQDANGNMWFKAPAGCTLTITLSSYTFRSGGNPTNYDRLYIYDDDGPITNNWNNYTAVRDWYNGHVAQNGNGTDRNTYTSTTTGGWISLRYQNNRTGDQNNRRSSFTVTIECNCSSSSGCDNATDLPCNTTNLAGTTEGAPNIPHGIPGADASNRGAWYTFTGDGSETTITTTSASFDNCIVVASGSCNNLTLVAEIDGSYGDESYSFQTTNGVTYYVYIAYYTSGNTTGTFNISRTCITAPSNSSCATATNLPCGTSNLAGTTVGTPGTAHGIPNVDVSNYGVWYTFVGNGNATTITTSNSTFDEEIVIARGSCNNLTFVGSIDGTTSGETYTFLAENGVTYYVYIAYYTSSNTTGTFNISRTCATAPSNSSCATATNLPCGTSNLEGTTVGTPGTAHGIPNADVSNYGVWYTFVGDGNRTTITSTAESGFDHEMDICSGSCDNLTLITDQDASGSDGTESYTFQTTNGVTYYVYIAYYYSDYYNTTGSFNISRTCVEPLCPPADMCELTFELTDSYGDGWNGASIQVVDVQSGSILGELTMDNGSYVSESLAVCNGREIRFVWVNGSYDDECSYTVYDVNGDVIFSGTEGSSLPLTYTPSCTVCPQPTNVTVTDITNTTAHVEWDGTADNYNVRYRKVLLSEGFESGIPATWTTIDADGDGNNWLALSEIPTTYPYYDGVDFSNWAHGGTNAAASPSYANGPGAFNSNHWLISPQITLGGSLKFYVTSEYNDQDSYEVLLSTTGTDPANFTATIQSMRTASYGSWDEVSINLSGYSGQGYIAIHHVSSDKYFLVIDDFRIYGDWTNRTANTNSINLTSLDDGTTYEVEVQADCGNDVTSPWTSPETFITPVCNLDATIEFGD